MENKIQNVTLAINGVDFEVKPYLTYTEIQSIANAVCKFDTWAEREQNIDILLLHFGTTLSKENIEEIGHDSFVLTGIMEQVRLNIKNFFLVYRAIDYKESTQRALAEILKQIPNFYESLKEINKKYAKSSQKRN